MQTAKAGTVEFSGVMHDLSMVIPSTVYLSSVTANLQLGDGASVAGQHGWRHRQHPVPGLRE